MGEHIPLSRPDLTEAEVEAVAGVLRTPFLSMGPAIESFERAFTEVCRRRHAIAVSSGTAGLHLAVRACGIGQGDEVVTTPFSFIASANCILYEGGVPVFADIDPQTWNLDPAKVAAAVGSKTRAILVVHVFGQPCEMDPISRIARQHGLRLIEDSCEALGAEYRGVPAGKLGDVSVFGFYPNKQITTGEGGMVLTDDDDLAGLIRSMRNQGRDPDSGWLAHPRLGFNYRMSEMQAALGAVQLSRLTELLSKRQRVADWYRQRLAEEKRLVLQKISDDVKMSWFVFVVRLADEYSRQDRDRILNELRSKGIGCSNYFTPIHLQPFYVEKFGYGPGDFPVCEHVADRTIALPFHPNLTEQEVDTVCRTLRSLL